MRRANVQFSQLRAGTAAKAASPAHVFAEYRAMRYGFGGSFARRRGTKTHVSGALIPQDSREDGLGAVQLWSRSREKSLPLPQ